MTGGMKVVAARPPIHDCPDHPDRLRANPVTCPPYVPTDGSPDFRAGRSCHLPPHFSAANVLERGLGISSNPNRRPPAQDWCDLFSLLASGLRFTRWVAHFGSRSLPPVTTSLKASSPGHAGAVCSWLHRRGQFVGIAEPKCLGGAAGSVYFSQSHKRVGSASDDQ